LSTPPPFSFSRDESLAQMARDEFDVCVIGAGINGAAIARDAALRGLKVALLEAGDFAGATSSRSSKLIHGGFRYLPRWEFGLVYHALRERERLRRRTAPHLVRPIRFLFPIYQGRGFDRFTMSIGLWLYDFFARTPWSERHRIIGAKATLRREAALATGGLSAAALYYDANADDARLTFENVLDAALHGAAVANYALFEGFEDDAEGNVAARVHDVVNDEHIEVRARLFVNAAGPWVDDIRRMDDPAAQPSVRLTKGVHLVFSNTTLAVQEPIVLEDEANRIVFVMPYDRYVLVGTTDTDFHGDRRAVVADQDDIKYLLKVLGDGLPHITLREEDIVSSFAGLRALVLDGGEKSPSEVTREETVLESASGMLSVAGGKLTTHRLIAEKVVHRALNKLGRFASGSPTRGTPLPGARPVENAHFNTALAADTIRLLTDRYGTRAGMVHRIAAERPELAELLAPNCPAIAAEVVHAVRNEMALCVADFLVRRTSLIWRYPVEAEAAAPAVARIMAGELGWDSEREEFEVAGFVSDLKRRRAA
jgi:glycerol-3-phosphate dehydrogenase